MSSKTEVKSAEEIRRRGIEVLAEALGPVDTVRFLQSFSLGKGDYTKERANVLNLELDEIVRAIEKRRWLEKPQDLSKIDS
jgi:hypothetical protein